MDPRYKRIRSLEMAWIFKWLSPRGVARIVDQECERMTMHLYGRALGLMDEQEDDFVDPICRQDAMVQRRNHNHGEE